MKKRFFRLIMPSLVIIVIMTACGATTRIASLIPPESEKLELFTTKLPDKEYTEIAYIQADGSILHTPQHLLNGLKKKAIALNADAIINIKYDFQAWYPLASGTAVKYKDK